MKTLQARVTPETVRVVKLLEKHFPNHPADYPVAAYRYNCASIRVRVVDESFTGLDWLERQEKVLPFLRKLPRATQSDIVLLLLLAPEEVEDSGGNREFENPSPPPVPDD